MNIIVETEYQAWYHGKAHQCWDYYPRAFTLQCRVLYGSYQKGQGPLCMDEDAGVTFGKSTFTRIAIEVTAD